MKARWIPCVIILMLVGLAGCAHRQLRWNTVQQSRTLTEIYEQQVLDNLAMFVHDSGSLPFFAFPREGGSDVTDSGQLTSDLGWDSSRFTGGMLGLQGGRDIRESWVLTPVTDSRRLELMRCAYQQAISSAGIGSGPAMSCPDCERLAKRFYTGSAQSEVSIAQVATDTGQVTSACLGQSPWFCWGCKKCVPKHCECLKVGSYCGTYVWLRPGGQEELSKLSLVILDYAIHDPPRLPSPPQPDPAYTVETSYFGTDGKPTTQANAHREVRSIKPMETLPPMTSGAGGTSSPQRSMVPEAEFAPASPGSFLLLENQLKFLTPRGR